MSVALSVHELELDSLPVCEHMLLPGADPCTFEEAICVGDHGQYRIEQVDEDLILAFGGRYPCSASRTVHLHRVATDWSDQALVDRLGGRSLVRLPPANFPRLLAEYWPTSHFRQRERGYLACMLECAVYAADFIVTAARGETGYILRQYPFPSKGRHDSNAFFAVPV